VLFSLSLWFISSSFAHFVDLPRSRKPLDWNTRMKIAAGAARGLEYLHDKMKPPVIYRDLKCSNILIGEGYHPKLSDFGLAKVGPSGDKTHVSTRVMGTYGYCAPDYAMTGQLTFKSDIYSFGVVLLEIITGRKAIDHMKPPKEQNLVAWVCEWSFTILVKIFIIRKLEYKKYTLIMQLYRLLYSFSFKVTAHYMKQIIFACLVFQVNWR